MTKAALHANIEIRGSKSRQHSELDWLDSYHSFDVNYPFDPRFTQFGSLRVLNEDRVAGNNGFPTHLHRNLEIFTYLLKGELTHRDSTVKRGTERDNNDKFARLRRGDVQFTTGGRGVSHSEINESNEESHFLQIWILPWTQGLVPRYHLKTFDVNQKRKGFVHILSPLAAGPNATVAEENAAVPTIPDTIPVHADFVGGAAIIGVGKRFTWAVGGEVSGEMIVTTRTNRHVYIHLPMGQNGGAEIRIDGREESILREGDGAFVRNMNAGDMLSVESIGVSEAEVVVLDSN